MPDQVSPYNQPERPAETKAATNVLELLDRILDKGLVIVGDIRVSVADIELLKIQIRLLIASVDKAKELGIDFSWAKEIEATKSKEELQQRISELTDRLQVSEGRSEIDTDNQSDTDGEQDTSDQQDTGNKQNGNKQNANPPKDFFKDSGSKNR
jgi:hypothetical protein